MSIKLLASMGFYTLSRIVATAMFAGMLMLTACSNVQPTVESSGSDVLPPTLTPIEVTPAVVTPMALKTSVPQPTWTPVPTWTPEPTWTPLPTATPTATFTPIPIATPKPTPTFTPVPTLTPTPTPHPCSLAVIEPADELQLVYTRFLAADPIYNSITPLAREALHRQFPTIAAAYVVEFIANPTRYTSFRDYLLREGSRAANANIATGFQALQDRDLLPSVGESLYEYNLRRASDPCTTGRSRIYADDGTMTLLAVGYTRSIYNPLYHDAATNVTINGINAFRFQDVTTPLIFWILEELVE